jgi:UDP-GlcNAc:undecaprenyl-phosphate GlcNAc-1-phosphate transferase
MTLFLCMCFSAIVCTVMIAWIHNTLAPRWGALDNHHQTWRKSHSRPIPRMGGLSIFIAAYAGTFCHMLLSAQKNGSIPLLIQPYIFLSAVFAVLLGIYDDIQGASAFKKCFIQSIIGFLIYQSGYGIEHVSLHPQMAFSLGAFSLPCTIAWFVVSMNAFNLIDGLDGLATGLSIVYCVFYLAFSFFLKTIYPDVFLWMFLSSLIVFYLHNKKPASIFLGDTGSLFLGFVFSFYTLYFHTDQHNTIHLAPMLMALALPLTDTFLAITRRFFLNRPIFQADKSHIHHQLIQSGYSVTKTNFILWSYNIIFILLSLIYKKNPALALTGCIISFFSLAFLGFSSKFFNHSIFSFLSWYSYRKKRNLYLYKSLKYLEKIHKKLNNPDKFKQDLHQIFFLLGSEKAHIRIKSKENIILFDFLYENYSTHKNSHNTFKIKTSQTHTYEYTVYAQWNSEYFNIEPEEEFSLETIHHLLKIKTNHFLQSHSEPLNPMTQAQAG